MPGGFYMALDPFFDMLDVLVGVLEIGVDGLLVGV